MDIEVMRCRIPRGNEYVVYLPRLTWAGSKESLWNEVTEKLSSCGLIYRTFILDSRSEPRVDEMRGYFGFVWFYSSKAAKEALALDSKLQLGDTNNTFRIIRRNKLDNYVPKCKLSLTKSQELISYYFGFNSWSSKLVYIEKENDVEDPSIMKYVCVVEIYMTKDDVVSEGIGVGKEKNDIENPSSRGIAIMTARRYAHHNAMVNAFSKFMIITLGNGKKTIVVDTTEADELYDPAWDNPVVKVTDLNIDPEDEELENNGLDDITEEELNALLNDSFTDC